MKQFQLSTILHLLLISLPFVTSQAGVDDELTCRAPKPSMGSAREYVVGANSWHIPVLDYLTDVVGRQFDPPISFRRTTANTYMKVPVDEALAMNFDFMIANPYVSSCYDTEGQTISLANQVIINQDALTKEYFNLTKYGATLYTLNNRTDIMSLADVPGKTIGTNKITNLATQLCYGVLLDSGLHHLQDPKQTIFFRNSNEALQALLDGKVDIGCAASSVLEKYIDPSTGERLDLSKIRVLNPRQHVLDGIDFPFRTSSELVPGYLVSVYPHVEQIVKIKFQEEILAMRDHADVAPSLYACLEGQGCFANNTECLEACFDSLPDETIRRCDTTAKKAVDSFDALQASNLVGFFEPLQNLRLRDMQETTGFLVKDDTSPRCVRMKNIVDAVTCPEGHFARSSQEIIQQCNASGLECYDKDCICSPCVEAFEVDFFPLPEDIDLNNTSAAIGSGCSKFSLCGSVNQEHVLSFGAIDNRQRLNATMSGAFLLPDETEVPFEFDNRNGTFLFDFTASRMTAGQKVIKVRINDEEIQESPFRILVLKRNCSADTGDDRREPDDLGQCVCMRGYVEISGSCISVAALSGGVLASFFFMLLVVVHFYVKHKKDQADNVWKVDPTELRFQDPPTVLGRGSFGLVLSAEYRGTTVAVKRALPPNKSNGKNAVAISHVEFIAQDVESAADDGDASSSFHPGGLSTMSNPSVVWKGKAGRRIKENISGNFTFFFRRIFSKRKETTLREQFIKEIRLLSSLRHPSITTVMGAVIVGKCDPMLVMEHMHFGSLHDLLHNESIFLENHVLIGLLQDVASGLRFLHSSTPLVLHGDLKSHNILVDDKFRAKVADFGCGDFTASKFGSTRRGKVRGTPYWMSPELLRGESINSKESDVYAFGIVMYEVFSRKDPYADEPYDDVLRLVSCEESNKHPPVPQSCPPEVGKIMMACLKWNPAERPTAMGLDIRLGWMGSTNVEMPQQQEEQIPAPRVVDALVEDMFPRHIAEALMEGKTVEPETHREVTILFSNIVGFEEMVRAMSATKVSNLVERLHFVLDSLCKRLEVFKVETVGDAHMIVTNLDESQSKHTSLAARFAIEAMQVASSVQIDPDDLSAGFVQLRVGLHTGPVVAHVIGTKNPRFTLIGDTVNTASQMEATSLAGRIQCSGESYYHLCLEQETLEFKVEERTDHPLKNRREMKFYWIEPEDNTTIDERTINC